MTFEQHARFTVSTVMTETSWLNDWASIKASIFKEKMPMSQDENRLFQFFSFFWRLLIASINWKGEEWQRDNGIGSIQEQIG